MIQRKEQDTQTLVKALMEIVGEHNVSVDADTVADYAHDETEDLSFPPQVVVHPESVEHVSAIMRYASETGTAVTPSAARTGLSGGAIPVHGGVALSMKRLNRILEIDTANAQATVEPGVINQVFHDACREEGLFYPPDPSSWGSSTIGGNIAYDAGGPKAVKYGVTSAYVLNLEVVLPNGDVIWTGANTLKNSTGYNLTQLFVGSEGTLGVITKAVLRLIPYPKVSYTMLAPFASARAACAAVAKVFQAGVTPSGLEFMERDAIDWTLKFVDGVNIPVGENVQAHLLMEVDGFDDAAVMAEAEKMAEVVLANGASDVLFAQSQSERDAIWALRRRVGEAVKSHSIYKEEDTVVPRAALPELLEAVKSIGSSYGFQSVCYGHAGDGNLHINIIKGDMSDEAWQGEKLKEGIRELFARVRELGGTISGEHGIGLVQKSFMDLAFDKAALQLQREIKHLLDPQGIMNPGKMFDQSLETKRKT